MDELLAARVRARNIVNAEASKLALEFELVFKPLVGRKILKVDGDFLRSVAKLIPGGDFWRNRSNYSLAWTVKACEEVQGSRACIYEEATFYVGTLEGLVLVSLYEPFTAKSDYTVTKVQAARDKYKEAKAVADAALNECFPFGEG